MRFTTPIEVSGIETVVFDRKKIWTIDEDEVWNGRTAEGTLVGIMNHKAMCDRIKAVERDSRYRMWIHGDTLNIVRRTPKVKTDPLVKALREMKAAIAREYLS